MHLTFSSWARCCSCNPATSCHLCSSNARRPFSLLLNCCIIMDNCLQKKKIGSYTRSSLQITGIYNLKENNKATEMFIINMFYAVNLFFSMVQVLLSNLIFWGKFHCIEKGTQQNEWTGVFYFTFFRHIFPKVWETFFSTGTMFCIFFFKVVHLLLQLVYGLLHPLLFILLL